MEKRNLIVLIGIVGIGGLIFLTIIGPIISEAWDAEDSEAKYLRDKHQNL